MRKWQKIVGMKESQEWFYYNCNPKSCHRCEGLPFACSNFVQFLNELERTMPPRMIELDASKTMSTWLEEAQTKGWIKPRFATPTTRWLRRTFNI